MDLGRLFQVSYVTSAIDDATAYLTRDLGARRLTRFDDLRSREGTPSSIRNLSHFVLGEMEVEVIEPRNPWPGSIYLDAVPDGEQPVTLHHVGFLSESREEWRSVVAAAEEQGIPVPVAVATPDVCYAYFDTRPRSGHFTEVVFREPGIGPGGVGTHPSVPTPGA